MRLIEATGQVMQSDIMGQGIELMVYGMGTVVVFLALLVVVTSAMSVLVARHFPEPVPPLPSRSRDGGDSGGNVVAAITAAIHLHRSKKR